MVPKCHAGPTSSTGLLSRLHPQCPWRKRGRCGWTHEKDAACLHKFRGDLRFPQSDCLKNLDILDWRGHFDWFFEQTHTHTLWAPELDQLCVDMFSSTFPRVWVLFQGQVCGIWLLALSFQRTSLRNRFENIHSNTDTIYGCVRSSENLNPMWVWHYVSTKARRGPDTFVPHNWILLFLKKLQLKNKRFHWWNKPILQPETTMITFQTQGTLSRVKLRTGILWEPDRRQLHRHYGCEEAIPDPGGHS